MTATVMMLMLQALAAPQPRMQCTPTLVAQTTPTGWDGAGTVVDGGRLRVGHAATVTLVAGKHFAVAPAKPSAAGASVSFDVPRAGRWRVSLDPGAWVDIVRGSAAIESMTHGHGAPCSPVKKQVEFDLKAGRYVLQLSGDAGARVRVMVAHG